MGEHGRAREITGDHTLRNGLSTASRSGLTINFGVRVSLSMTSPLLTVATQFVVGALQASSCADSFRFSFVTSPTESLHSCNGH